MNNYVLEGIKGFTDKQFYSGLKSKYKLFKVFERENKSFPVELKDFIEEIWESIIPLTLEDCLNENNQTLKTVLFSCYGAENIVKLPKCKIIDTYNLTRKNKKIVDNKVVEYDLKEIYELYSIPGEFLGKTYTRWDTNRYLKILKCVCPTTSKEYFLFVQDDINNALDAICSTFRIRWKNKDIIKIVRQGDVFLIKVKETAEPNYRTVAIDADTYLNKFEWQS